MNFLPAEIDGDRIVLPMVALPLPRELRAAVPQITNPLVAGVRPESFRDASLGGTSGSA